MKKKQKCALGLVAAMAAVMALGSCDNVIKSTSGSILTLTDAEGKRTSYTTEDLFGDYRESSSSYSSEFDQIYEAMIRHYYKANPSKLETLEDAAREAVVKDKNTAKKNAGDNGDYAAEFEKIMSNHGCKNAKELYEYHLYQEEKADFEKNMYADWNTGSKEINGVEAIKDGYYMQNGNKVEIMKEDANNNWGVGSEGWLKEQVPFHTRHILVKLEGASSGAYTQDKIKEEDTSGQGGETVKLANIVFDLAGATREFTKDDDHPGKVLNSTIGTATNRKTFGEIAKRSDDTGSAENFGDAHSASNPAITKVMPSEFVPEYKLGIMAYESLYKYNGAAAANEGEYHKNNKYRIAPGLTSDADSMDDVDANQIIDDTGETIYDFFKNEGIGTIPFGAVVALRDHANDQLDNNNVKVNDGNSAYYPRNVLFNKYFNKRNVCVITPNAVWSNALTSSNAETVTAALTTADVSLGGAVTSQDYVGAYTSEYGNLPGFQVDTTNILPQFDHNVLTDDTGNIILAVRAMSSGYQGIHFITIDRSGLSEFGEKLVNNKYVELAKDEDKSVATLSEYWTTYTPSNVDSYPYYEEQGKQEAKTTFVNYNKQMVNEINSRAEGLANVIKSYNSNLDTYFFEWLVKNEKITFADQDLENSIRKYSQMKRSNSADSAFDTWKDNWKSYAEALEAQEEARDIEWEDATHVRGTTGNGDGLGWLLPESVVIGFNDPAVRRSAAYAALWEEGGACYYED